MIDFEQDAAAPAGSDALQRIADLARLMVEQQAAVTAAETALALAKAALFRTETEDLPDLMEELQLSELKLTDGSKVSVKRDYHCGLSEERRPAGLAWLEEHGFSGLIKTDLVLSFGREEAELATLPPEFAPPFDLLVADLSFISQTLVLPAIVPFLKEGGTLLMLVKPQFELQPGQVGKGGIVKDDSLYPFIENRVRTALSDLGMQVTAWLDSPIEGGDGNREFFVQACWPDPAAVLPAREKARLAHEADLAAKAYAKANEY